MSTSNYRRKLNDGAPGILIRSVQRGKAEFSSPRESSTNVTKTFDGSEVSTK